MPVEKLSEKKERENTVAFKRLFCFSTFLLSPTRKSLLPMLLVLRDKFPRGGESPTPHSDSLKIVSRHGPILILDWSAIHVCVSPAPNLTARIICLKCPQYDPSIHTRILGTLSPMTLEFWPARYSLSQGVWRTRMRMLLSCYCTSQGQGLEKIVMLCWLTSR